MQLNHKQLINLPVYTQGQQLLGRVCGFEFNAETHTIIKYFVAKSGLVKELLNLGDELEIASAQVVSITEEKMVVEDNIKRELNVNQAKVKQPVAAMPASFSRVS